MSRTTVIYPDADALAHATAARLLTSIADAVAERGVAHIVLTGGTVGIATLAAAAESPLRAYVDWTSVHLWWGDERFVAAGHADRNEGQAQQALIGALPIPEDNVHRAPSSDDAPGVDDAAATYGAELAAFGSPVPEFDVLLLGLGPDAHVASLFPGHAGFADTSVGAIGVQNSPKPPPERVSLSLSAINCARQVWVVAAGDGKAAAVADCLHGVAEMPGARVAGTERTLWLIDAAASTNV